MNHAVRRLGLPVLVAGVVGIVLIAAASLVLAVSYRDQFTGLQHVIITRCEQRAGYDESQHRALGALLGYLTDQQQQAALNAPTTERLIEALPARLRPALRRETAQSQQTLAQAVSSLSAAYKSGVIGNCSVFR